MRSLLAAGLGFLLLGLAVGAWFGKRAWDRSALAKVAAAGETVAAQVIDLKALDRKGTRWAVTYRFSAKGRFYERTVRGVPAATREKLALGSVLQVRYEAASPDRSFCSAEPAPEPPSAGDWCAAGIPPLLGVALFAVAWLTRRRDDDVSP